MDEKSVSLIYSYKLILSSEKKYICKNIGCEESFVYTSQRNRRAQKRSKEKPQKLVKQKHRNISRDTSDYVSLNQKGAKKSSV